MTATPITRCARWAGIAGLLVLAPACTSDGMFSRWLGGPGATSPYVANRPIYPDGGRPFFIGGYAGANYEPIIGGARPVVGPPVPVPAPVPPPGPPEVSVTVNQGSWETE
jgi:hypothetical protein